MGFFFKMVYQTRRKKKREGLGGVENIAGRNLKVELRED